MGKFRSKLKGQTKGKRWPKGQSSSSNPETKKFRDQAKSRFFQVNLGPSSLTSDALKKHNSVQSATVSNDLDSDIDSQSSRTFDTFASDWSNCSNVSFNKLLTTFRTDSALHKEMLAVLAAVTEVIKSNKGTESSTEYYAALMTALEASQTEESATAILSLLAMGVKTVPQSILRVQFSNASTIYLQILSQYSQDDNNVIIRSILTCLSTFLRAQELAAWSSSYTVKVFDSVLVFVNHSKPKIRKCAQHAIASVLNASCFMLPSEDGEELKAAPTTCHPVGAHVAQFCVKQIESSVGSSGGQTTTLHTLTLLKDVIQVFPKAQIKSVCETLLKVMTLNNPLVNSCSLQVMHALFSGQKTVVPALLNDQLILALYDYQPSVTDVQPTLAWMAVMKQAHIHLVDVDESLCMKRMPRIFQVFTQLFLTDRPEIVTSVTLALDDLIRDCLGAITESPDKVRQYDYLLKQCFEIIEEGLGYQYHSAWSNLLHLINTIFKVAGANCQELLIPFLKTMSSLRDSYKFSYNNELEYAVGAAIRTIGPEIVLQVIPLTNAQSKVILDRSWLLPVLKDNIQHSRLEYFNLNIRPLAEQCEKESKILFKNNNGIGGHSMELLSSQLWSLFPSFCNSPSDTATSFKKIAQAIGFKISNDKNLRLPLMSGLRKLISNCKENQNTDDEKELSRFAKNYLPIFFNIYTTKANGTDEEGHRLASFDTIKVYLTITPVELRETLFKEAIKQLDTNKDQQTRESIFDLTRLLAIYQNKEQLYIFYKQFVTRSYASKNHKEQKKAYRLLEDICSSDTEGCKQFVYENKKKLKELFLKTLESTSASSKAARLRCLNLVLFKTYNHIDPENKLVQEALAESITNMKDINEKCRHEAQALLLAIGEALIKSKHGREQYLGALMAGFTGTHQMVVGTILALASSIHNFTGSLGAENIELILKTNCQLMISHNREIVQACLSFLQVFITRMPIAEVGAVLSTIVKALCSMNEDCKRHFRIKIRNLLNRLIRKFGCDSISSLVPQNDTVMHKRLRNLRKMNARKKRLKEKEDIEEDAEEDFAVDSKPRTVEAILADSDSEIEDTDNDKPTNRNNRAKSNTWIHEDGDDIVDFTDASAVSKIIATNPQQNKNKPINKSKIKDRGFKTASDGRLLITGDSDDSDKEDNPKSKKNKINFESDSDIDDNDGGASAAETLVLGAGKRKRTISDSVSMFSGVSSSGRPAMKYRAGGTGIHRPIKPTASETGSAYKARKAVGDVRKAGKVDPYAYVPLKRSTLNKRKRLKNSGQFKNLLRSAKKGAKKGLKNRKSRQ